MGVLWAGAGDRPGPPGLVRYRKDRATPCTPASGEGSTRCPAGGGCDHGVPRGSLDRAETGQVRGQVIWGRGRPPGTLLRTQGGQEGAEGPLSESKQAALLQGPHGAADLSELEGPGPRGLGSPRALSPVFSIKVRGAQAPAGHHCTQQSSPGTCLSLTRHQLQSAVPWVAAGDRSGGLAQSAEDELRGTLPSAPPTAMGRHMSCHHGGSLGQEPPSRHQA